MAAQLGAMCCPHTIHGHGTQGGGPGRAFLMPSKLAGAPTASRAASAGGAARSTSATAAAAAPPGTRLHPRTHGLVRFVVVACAAAAVRLVDPCRAVQWPATSAAQHDPISLPFAQGAKDSRAAGPAARRCGDLFTTQADAGADDQFFAVQLPARLPFASLAGPAQEDTPASADVAATGAGADDDILPTMATPKIPPPCGQYVAHGSPW